ncbi:MAG: UDP-3-O-(3-hydroxymyristoyl)glucosamine N-acyltransferase [Candidatus Coatesbacteria bacterium]
MPTLAELAALTGGAVDGRGDLVVTGVAAVEDAGPGTITFVTDDRFLPKLAACGASAVLLGPGRDRAGKDAIVHPQPMAALPRLLAAFAPEAPLSWPDPVHATAAVHPTARIAAGARVGPHAVIEAGVEVGEGTVVGPLVFVGWGSRIGKGCRLDPFTAVGARTSIGDRVIVHSGCVIAGDGFGFLPVPGVPVKIPQIGRVVIEDDVEIGAATTVDRATVGETVIRRGAKLDDQVHVAHNCVIGEGALLAGQVGFGGSVTVGKGVMFGGQVGVAPHLTLGDGAQLGAKSGVHRDVKPGEKIFGNPARPAGEAIRLNAEVARLPKLVARVRDLERRIRALEAGAADKTDA